MSEFHSQFVRAVDWLGYPVTIFQVSGHLKGVDVHIGRLAQSHELPQRHSKGPLGQDSSIMRGHSKTGCW